MKKGKKCFLSTHPSFVVKYGTVDCIEFKSVYLTLNTWVEPKIYIENPKHSINILSRAIKHHLLSVNNLSIFKEKFIVDLDLRFSGIDVNKRSFMSIDCHFYFQEKSKYDFKDPDLVYCLKSYANSIIDNVLLMNDRFIYHNSKSKKLNFLLEYIT